MLTVGVAYATKPGNPGAEGGNRRRQTVDASAGGGDGRWEGTGDRGSRAGTADAGDSFFLLQRTRIPKPGVLQRREKPALEHVEALGESDSTTVAS